MGRLQTPAVCLSLGLLLTLLPALPWAESANGPPDTTYRSTVSEVRVTFFATDENNHLVDNVRKDDFAIVDGDLVVREFRSLTRSQETALDVVIVVDASESVADRFQLARNDVLQLVSRQDPAAADNLSVISFAGPQPTVICDHNCGIAASSQKLLALQPAGATPLFDTLVFGANFIRVAPGVRPILVLFSDGDDTISKTSPRDALQSIIASGALLYAVDTSRPGATSRGSLALQKLAEATGGRYFSLHGGAANVLEAALEDLRSSYVVTYPLPSAAEGFHSLRILPKHNLSLRFHCRNGYYYGASIP